MNNVPQYSLRWNNYVNHITEAFSALRFENDLVDVTLCCDGGKIKAHKMLLSACSSYFKQIFQENPCQHPVIIFRYFKFEDLNAIINFMYHGEVNIIQERLESFLITAELLEVKGLTDNSEAELPASRTVLENSLDLSSKSSRAIDDIEPVLSDEPINLATMQPSREPFIPPIIDNDKSTEPLEVVITEDSNRQLMPAPSLEDMQIDTQSTSTEDVFREMITDGGTSSQKQTVSNSESELAKFRCQLCPKGFKHPTSLTLHKDSHAGKTQCPVCHRSFSRSYDMKSHLQRIHQRKQLTIKEIQYKNTSDVIASKQSTHNI